MRKFSLIIFFAVSLISWLSCSKIYQSHSVQYRDYRILSSFEKDDELVTILKPYSDSVNSSMNDIVGVASITLEKKTPESSLGNFMADAFYTMAKEKFNVPVDIAITNFGGIRLVQLPAGNVTRSKIFELMPFDNLLILQKIKGDVLKEYLDLIAARDGWPVAGMTMQIKDKKAINVMIGGKPLDPDAVYTVAQSDFLANGGDKADMLRAIPAHNIGYLMRDALIDYIGVLKGRGMDISAKVENRVSYAQ
ncbi:MAG TPA: 5'-nucleotidase [Chitinophagaceae bacterium]|nr:5'-nucleotidase [Chitinophagaceae bacterium]